MNYTRSPQAIPLTTAGLGVSSDGRDLPRERVSARSPLTKSFAPRQHMCLRVANSRGGMRDINTRDADAPERCRLCEAHQPQEPWSAEPCGRFRRYKNLHGPNNVTNRNGGRHACPGLMNGNAFVAYTSASASPNTRSRRNSSLFCSLEALGSCHIPEYPDYAFRGARRHWPNLCNTNAMPRVRQAVLVYRLTHSRKS